MTNINNTYQILRLYLKELSVKASRNHIKKLLDTPMGNSVRGISDALDELHVSHEVYQDFPVEYLEQLTTPFIATLQNGKYCIVLALNDKTFTLISHRGKTMHLLKDDFITIWNKNILIAERPTNPYKEPFYIIKELVSIINEYNKVVIIILLGGIVFFTSPSLFNIFTWIGLIISIFIIYKENYNENFLKSFCKIGKHIDCNKILHSKMSSLNGIITFGELALLYFSSLFIYTNIHYSSSYFILLTLTTIALVFTFFSLIYQLFIAHKYCTLCFALNIIIWGQASMLCIMYEEEKLQFHLLAVVLFMLISIVCTRSWYLLKNLLIISETNKYLKEKRQHLLSYPNLFDFLLKQEKYTPIADTNVTLHSYGNIKNNIQIIINPSCKYCSKNYKKWFKLAPSLNIIFWVNPNDFNSKKVALNIISCYLQKGFKESINLLEKWFKEKNIEHLKQFYPTEKAIYMFNLQQEYCKTIHLQYTPFITINGKNLPSVYDLEDLQYIY